MKFVLKHKYFFVLILLISFVFLLVKTKEKVFLSNNSKKQKLALQKTSNYKNSDDVMQYIYNSPESNNDVRYEYHWEILKTALEKTKKNYGKYLMKKAKLMSEKRQAFELINKTNVITVMYLDTKPEYEEKLYPIHIPVDKNLGGYRVMIIKKDSQNKFNSVKTIQDFQKLTIGQGYGWIDVDILNYNKFKVVTGSNYEGLFKMLDNNRFEAFSRSAIEIIDEFEKRKDSYTDLKIEDSLLLYYPLPMYFWFSKSEAGKKLAKRVKEGMELMIEDGTYNEIFNRYHSINVKKLNLKKRRIFRINNPFLVPETPFNDKKLWYNLTTE